MVSREMESRIPTAARLTTRDVAPALTNGSGMPVRGSSVVTTPMLMSPWKTSQAVMPKATSAPKVSGAPSAIRTPR